MTESANSDDSLPWFVKAAMAVAALVVVFIVVVDLATFAGAL
jgi:hypothetical protein